MNHETEKWAENVLAVADSIQRAKAPDSFYQKTLSRLKAAETVSGGYVLRIAAGILLLVAFNVFACASFSKFQGGDNEHLQAFAKEYSLTSSTNNF